MQDPRLNFCLLNQSVQVLYSVPLLHVPYVPPTDKDLEILVDPMVDEYFEPPTIDTPVPPAVTVHVPNGLNGPPFPISIAPYALSASYSPSSSYIQSPLVHQGTVVDNSFEANPFAPPNDDPFDNIFAPEILARLHLFHALNHMNISANGPMII